MKFKFRLILISIMGLMLVGADYLGDKEMDKKRLINGVEFQVTIFHSSIAREQLSALAEDAFLEAERITNHFFAAKPEGVISKIHEAKSGEEVALSNEEFYILKEAFSISKLTEGAYDLAQGALMQLWEKAHEASQPPQAAEIDFVLPHTGYQNITMNPTNKTIVIQKEDIQLNIDNLAVAYAVDQVAKILKDRGVSSGMVSAEQNTRLIGLSNEGRAWNFGIEHPRVIDQYAATLSIDEERSISTTGDYEKFFLYQGERYPLILNSNTGKPPINQLVSVTVTAKNTLWAKALGRAFFILGSDRGYEMIERLKDERVQVVCLEETSKDRFALSGSDGVQELLKDISL